MVYFRFVSSSSFTKSSTHKHIAKTNNPKVITQKRRTGVRRSVRIPWSHATPGISPAHDSTFFFFFWRGGLIYCWYVYMQLYNTVAVYWLLSTAYKYKWPTFNRSRHLLLWYFNRKNNNNIFIAAYFFFVFIFIFFFFF